MRFSLQQRTLRSALATACAATIALAVVPGSARAVTTPAPSTEHRGMADSVVVRGEEGSDASESTQAVEERIPGKLLPPDLGADRPLIVLLHWYSGRVEEVIDRFGIGQVAYASGWVVVAPTGLSDSRGQPYWNATPTCCDRDLRGNDDVSYLRGFIADAVERYPVDPNRVVVVGLSNGAFMAYRLACEASDLVTAIVAIAGVESLDPIACSPAHPVSVLHIHGINDRAVFFQGGNLSIVTEVWAPYPSAEETVRRWVHRNRCPTSDPITVSGAVGQAGFWFGCDLGTSVQYMWLPRGHEVQIDESLASSMKRFIDHSARRPLPPPSCAAGPC